jgi:hypothetical protein
MWYAISDENGEETIINLNNVTAIWYEDFNDKWIVFFKTIDGFHHKDVNIQKEDCLYTYKLICDFLKQKSLLI